MFARHKSKKAMRAYLLGSLDDRAAAAVELRYFTEPAWLTLIQMVETDLIRDYLDGRLQGEQRKRFEERYLKTPALLARIEEVRNELAVTPAPKWFVVRWQVIPLVIVVALLAGVGYKLFQRAGGPAAAPRPVVAQMKPLISVDLTPGATKGSTSEMISFVVAPGKRVRLRFELPGRSTPLPCRVVLSAIGADGRRLVIWRSASLASAPDKTGSWITVELGSSQLRPGDYVAEALDDAGDHLESYLFRVRAAQDSSDKVHP